MSERSMIAPTLGSFAVFGAFWGAWGASIPRVRDQAGVSDGELGVALLCIGAGALPAMLLMGRIVDRWGLRTAAATIAGLGLAGCAVALGAHSFGALVVGLLVVGVMSGSADVAMNSVAGRAEQLAGRPVITRAHGVLSAFVVLGSLGAGAVAAAGAPLAVPFAVIAACAVVIAGAMARALPAAPPRLPREASGVADARSFVAPLLLLGVLGALGFSSEGAHQSWSALFAADVLDASAGRAALAPALFAIVVAITRLAVGGLGARHARAVLVVGGLAAAVGAAIIAAADGTLTFALGLVVAGAGTAVLFPTVLGVVSRTVDEARRGRATSLVTTVSYLGFLLGPAYVGAWASSASLRTAMVAVGALGLALALLAPILLPRGRSGPTTAE